LATFARAQSLQIESIDTLASLFEHDLFRKPVSTLGSSPRASFFGIML
jgi:hypothetical protein